MLLQLGSLGTVPTVLVGLLALAAVVFVGRVVLEIAWKLVLAALVVVGALWLLGFVGVGVV